MASDLFQQMLARVLVSEVVAAKQVDRRSGDVSAVQAQERWPGVSSEELPDESTTMIIR